MQFLYATQLALPREPSAAGTVREQIGTWLSERLCVEVEDWRAGDAAAGEAAVRWRTSAGVAGTLLDVVAEHLDRVDGHYRWSTQLWLGVEDAGAWLRVRVGVEALRDGVVVEPNLSIGRPGIVKSVTTALPLQADGFPIGEYLRITRGDVEAYTALLLDAGRRMPVVTVTKASGRLPFLHPSRLADRLLGIAHVVALDPDATYAVSERLGSERSIYGGAVRLYWPGFRADSPLRQHPLWLPGNLDYYGLQGFEQLLVGLVGRVAALSIAERRLIHSLRREERQAQAEVRARKLAEQRERRQAEASTGETEALFDGLSADYDEPQTRYSSLEGEHLQLLEELETARAAQERADAIAKQAFIVASAGPAEAGRQENLPAPRTVLEAVEQAQLSCSHHLHAQGVDYHCERKLSGTVDEGHLRPDFSFIDDAGDVVVWEHLGMLDRPDYAAGWDWKRSWYTRNGFTLDENLFVTDEIGGLDMRAVDATAAKVCAALR